MPHSNVKILAFLVAVQCLHKSVLGAARRKRDLIYENMVMRNKYNSTTRDEMRKLMVGGGILERKVIAAKNGTENRHEESREMECCNMVRVTGARNGGAMDTVAECHPYAMGLYKKIGVCGGRSIYQHDNNTEIFMYYGCGRWFIGLEIGVCGGWVFTKTSEICIHGQHEKPWQFVSETGLNKDRSFHVQQDCDVPRLLKQRPAFDDEEEIRKEVTEAPKPVEIKKYSQELLDLSALYKQPLLNYNINEITEE